MKPAPATGYVDVELEVPFHDLDPLRIVWHGHYAKYAEIGRTALLRSRGLDMQQIEEAGCRLVVVETRCRHSFPLFYGDRFRVRSWLVDVDFRVNIGFEIHNLTRGRRSARGSTIIATTGADGTLMLETPDALVRRLRA